MSELVQGSWPRKGPDQALYKSASKCALGPHCTTTLELALSQSRKGHCAHQVLFYFWNTTLENVVMMSL